MSPINHLFVPRDVDASATSSDSTSASPTSSSPSVFDGPPPPNIPGWVGWLILAIFIILLMMAIRLMYKESNEYLAKRGDRFEPTKRYKLSPSEKRQLSLGKLPRPTIAPPPAAHIAVADNAAHSAEDALFHVTATNTLKNQRRAAQVFQKADMVAPPLPPILRPAGALLERKLGVNVPAEEITSRTSSTGYTDAFAFGLPSAKPLPPAKVDSPRISAVHSIRARSNYICISTVRAFPIHLEISRYCDKL
ncbi:hypothetical protein B0H16DRAFT_1775601 [Mycena metata]|uniref:Uncharacterized protein n=1 Tax=Mycena metata TaxID=1033252 RepID=A0AAD7HXD2_9AGAR|nr:hypothetical protein B0H16DRAFT_1775601 [Mycena metata]